MNKNGCSGITTFPYFFSSESERDLTKDLDFLIKKEKITYPLDFVQKEKHFYKSLTNLCILISEGNE